MRETAQCQCTWWTTYSLGKEVNGHVFLRSYEEAFKAIEEYEEEYEVKTTIKFVCWKRPENFGNNGKLVDVRMGGKQRKIHTITASILNSKYIHNDFGWDSVPFIKGGGGGGGKGFGSNFLQRKNEKAAKIIH